MEKSIHSKSLYRLILGCFILLTSCSHFPSLTPTVTPAISTETVTIQPTKIPTSGSPTLVSKTPSLTPVPTITASPTPVPSLTPLPTLDPEVAQLEIARLMETNGPCSGTCFWGITPGVTHFDDAIRFLKTIEDKVFIDTSDHFSNDYEYKGTIINVALEIIGSKGMVQNLQVTVDGIGLPGVTGKDWLAFRPDSFLKAHGVPKRVNIIMAMGAEGRIRYEMFLFYDQMYIRYSGNQVMIYPQTILYACPLRDNNMDRSYLKLGDYDEDSLYDGVELSRMSPLSADQFYKILVGPPEQACFSLDFNKFYSSR